MYSLHMRQTIYGLFSEFSFPLQTCGDIGCCVGSASVQHEGAVLSAAAWQKVKASIEKLETSQKLQI